MVKYFNKTRTYMIRTECYGGKDMEIGYQEDIDDLAIILTPDYEYKESVEVDMGFIIDLDKNDKIVAIEIIDCSRQIGKSKEYVKKAKKEVFVEIYEFSYRLIVSFNDGEEEIIKRVLK